MKMMMILTLALAAAPLRAQDDHCTGFSPMPPDCQPETTNNIDGGGQSDGGAGLGSGPAAASFSGFENGGFSRKLGGGGGGGTLPGGGVGGGGSVGGGTVGGESAGPVNVPPSAADIPSGCPTPGRNVVMKRVYPGQGSINFTFDEPRADGLAPTIYAFRLPTYGGKMAKSAGFEFVRTEVPVGAAKIGFSRCPGDFSWAKNYSYKIPVQKTHVKDANGCFILANGESSADYPGYTCYGGAISPATAGQPFNPCYSENRSLDSYNMSYLVGQPSASYGAASVGWMSSCPIPPQPDGHTWYMNVQYVDGSGKGTCPNFKWQCNNAFVWHGDQSLMGTELLPEEKANEFYDRGPVANHYRAQSHWSGYCDSPDNRPWVMEPDCTPRP